MDDTNCNSSFAGNTDNEDGVMVAQCIRMESMLAPESSLKAVNITGFTRAVSEIHKMMKTLSGTVLGFFPFQNRGLLILFPFRLNVCCSLRGCSRSNPNQAPRSPFSLRSSAHEDVQDSFSGFCISQDNPMADHRTYRWLLDRSDVIYDACRGPGKHSSSCFGFMVQYQWSFRLSLDIIISLLSNQARIILLRLEPGSG
ncbi:hypothetical protein N657DRAFT_36081 [Parathielavia appendiculata]|uniref:Uncharacterized protein n=1 Tax=Parathielavia appendiculata TaxID=2587402 RepID=A0AAN6UA29_9PEZI|nr:hypothetical protein N657DRAFT_36081 [Parathielavia appendiculata]